MRSRYLWPLVLAIVLVFAFFKGGIYPIDFRFRHSHNEAPAVVTEAPLPEAPIKTRNIKTAETINLVSDSARQPLRTDIETYERSFKKDFNPFDRFNSRVIGTVNLNYNGFAAHFRMIIKKSDSVPGEWQNYPILFESLSNSKAGVSTSATLQSMMSTEGNQIIFHIYSPIVVAVLETKDDERLNSLMKRSLGEIADVMVGITPQSNSTPIYIRRHLDPSESPVQAGEFNYRIEM
jgi:hypothetical protein